MYRAECEHEHGKHCRRHIYVHISNVLCVPAVVLTPLVTSVHHSYTPDELKSATAKQLCRSNAVILKKYIVYCVLSPVCLHQVAVVQ
jgi:hypothetical protein